jgi:hypothetical protein
VLLLQCLLGPLQVEDFLGLDGIGNFGKIFKVLLDDSGLNCSFLNLHVLIFLLLKGFFDFLWRFHSIEITGDFFEEDYLG